MSEDAKSLLKKGPSFVPTQKDINWYSVRQNFDKFVNKLRFQVNSKLNEGNGSSAPRCSEDTVPYKKSTVSVNYRVTPTKSKSFEAFVEAVERDLFDPSNIQTSYSNLTNNERKAMKEIITCEENSIRVQDKGSRFVVLNSSDYVSKIEEQIQRSSFTVLQDDPTEQFEERVVKWSKKWVERGAISKDWALFIEPSLSKPGNMHGLIKTHKTSNPSRVISSGCGTAIENLSIFVEKYLYKEAAKLPSRIRDTGHMLDIIDELNAIGLPRNCILVSFDVVNMFPSIDNKSGMETVKHALNERLSKNPPTSCLIEALSICLECNNSTFNDKQYLQTDGTAQGPHMSCSYSDLAMSP